MHTAITADVAWTAAAEHNVWRALRPTAGHAVQRVSDHYQRFQANTLRQLQTDSLGGAIVAVDLQAYHAFNRACILSELSWVQIGCIAFIKTIFFQNALTA